MNRVKVAPVSHVGRTLQAPPGERETGTGRAKRRRVSGALLERTAKAKKIADEVYRKVKEINDVKNADTACCIHKGGQESHIEENPRSAMRRFFHY